MCASIVKEGTVQALGYYDEPGRSAAAKLLTRDEARRIAACFTSVQRVVALDYFQTSPSCRGCCALTDPILPPLYDRKRCFDRT
jgi:hypothetical protein